MNACPDQIKKIVSTELAYYRHTHKANMIATPELCRRRGIPHEEKFENLCLLLNDDSRVATLSSVSSIDLPPNINVLRALDVAEGPSTTQEAPVADDTGAQTYEINEMCVVMWQEEKQLTWHIGYVKKRLSKSLIEVEHLHRVSESKHDYW